MGWQQSPVPHLQQVPRERYKKGDDLCSQPRIGSRPPQTCRLGSSHVTGDASMLLNTSHLPPTNLHTHELPVPTHTPSGDPQHLSTPNFPGQPNSKQQWDPSQKPPVTPLGLTLPCPPKKRNFGLKGAEPPRIGLSHHLAVLTSLKS